MKFVTSKGKAAISRMDLWFIGAILFIVLFGLIAQYSIGQAFTKQLIAVLIGLSMFIGLSMSNYRIIKTHPFIYYIAAILILIAVLAFGTTVRGTTGWFIIGGLSVQPVEFVKLLFILFIAALLDRDISKLQSSKYVLLTGVFTSVICGLIFLQPDLGSAFIIFMLWFVYLLVLKSPKWAVVVIVLTVVIAALIGWFFVFQDYQKQRLTTFISAESDPLGAGYNVSQSIVAVGSGSFWGRGLGLGPQSQLHFLPEASSDFIFAVIAEEFGFIGVFVLFLGYAVIVWRLWRWMIQARNNYTFLILLGVCTYLVLQSTLVIGMNTGLLPVTGVPLPLLSAGGTSMLATLVMLGLAHAIGLAKD